VASLREREAIMIKKIGPRAMGMATLMGLGALVMLVGIMGNDVGAAKPADTDSVPSAKNILISARMENVSLLKLILKRIAFS